MISLVLPMPIPCCQTWISASQNVAQKKIKRRGCTKKMPFDCKGKPQLHPWVATKKGLNGSNGAWAKPLAGLEKNFAYIYIYICTHIYIYTYNRFSKCWTHLVGSGGFYRGTTRKPTISRDPHFKKHPHV